MSYNLVTTFFLATIIIVLVIYIFISKRKRRLKFSLITFALIIVATGTLVVIGHSSWNRHKQLTRIINQIDVSDNNTLKSIDDKDAIQKITVLPTPRDIVIDSEQYYDKHSYQEVVSINGKSYILTIVVPTETYTLTFFETWKVRSITENYEFTPPIEDVLRNGIVNQHLNGNVTYEPNKRMISFSLNVKTAITKVDAERIVGKILDDVASITGQSNVTKVLKSYRIEFQILQGSTNDKVLYSGFKKINSAEIVWE